MQHLPRTLPFRHSFLPLTNAVAAIKAAGGDTEAEACRLLKVWTNVNTTESKQAIERFKLLSNVRLRM